MIDVLNVAEHSGKKGVLFRASIQDIFVERAGMAMPY